MLHYDMCKGLSIRNNFAIILTREGRLLSIVDNPRVLNATSDITLPYHYLVLPQCAETKSLQPGISSMLLTFISGLAFIFRLRALLAGYTTENPVSIVLHRDSVAYIAGLTDSSQAIRAPQRL